MDALVLSCSTGGGHNAAGKAVVNELKKRGHNVTFMDPYTLKSNKLANAISNAYVGTVQNVPGAFGFIYMLGEGVRKMPGTSPVNWVNHGMAPILDAYLKEHHTDVIITPHLYPAEITTIMKKKGMDVPKTVFIATDYTCIPFTEETETDYCIVPHEELVDEFSDRGIKRETILPFGIPVSTEFNNGMTKEQARIELKMKQDKKYILISGGSIGAGAMEGTVKLLLKWMETHTDTKCVVICGRHKQLYNSFKKLSEEKKGLHVLTFTNKMPLYMKACDMIMVKPGGLSSTEAAVAECPLVHLPAIPGCEDHNRSFFTSHGMNLYVKNPKQDLIPVLERLRREANVLAMKNAMKETINKNACIDICNFVESLV